MNNFCQTNFRLVKKGREKTVVIKMSWSTYAFYQKYIKPKKISIFSAKCSPGGTKFCRE